jgi:hypothetical protein
MNRQTPKSRRFVLAASCGGGAAQAFGESWATPTLPRARKKKKRTAKKPDDASPFIASGEGTSPERVGGDIENAVRSRPRTSLGDGVVKPVGSRIE